MATYSRQLLSGSVNGQPIVVAATASPGTTVHTAVAGAQGNFDEVYIWAANVTGSAATLTIQWGGTTDPDSDACKAYSIPANSGLVQITAGQVLQNSLVIRAYSGTASAINLIGYVNRIQ